MATVRGKRILRYVGNKPTPEQSLYSTEEILELRIPMAGNPFDDLMFDRQMRAMMHQRAIVDERARALTGQPRRLGEKVQVLMVQEALSMAVRLCTNDARIPHMTINMSYFTHSDDTYLREAIRQYVQQIVRGGFATPEEIDVRIPNLYSHHAEMDRENLERYRQAQQFEMQLQQEAERKQKRKTPNPFEVNMVEALVGWKGWKLGDSPIDSGQLISPSYGGVWKPDEPFQATCGECTDIPHESHSCGVYATDALDGAKGYGIVRGEVYGWGRYIRGDKGWRCQFAYPKAFYLDEGQGHLVEQLRAFHVPVYVKQPMLIYSPEEDGYDGHWNAETDGDCRAGEESNAGEAGDQDS